MSSGDQSQLLVLHAVRLLGFGAGASVARRFGLDADEVAEVLLDAEALGWVSRSTFGSTTGWSLSDAGRAEGERLLAVDLEERGCRATVQDVHEEFLPLNGRALQGFTRWQVRPVGAERLAPNEHDDLRWDDRVLDELASVGFRLQQLGARLEGSLPRTGGYSERYATALSRGRTGERSWVDGLGVDSCHRVWIELHEDLIATLGLRRG